MTSSRGEKGPKRVRVRGEERPERPDRDDPPGSGLELTAELLHLARAGDEGARGRLVARYIPLLQRWARGRLPGTARSVAETDDLVQLTLIRALGRVDSFEPRREGAFLAYLRKILLNTIREEIRRTSRHVHETLPDAHAADEPGDSSATLDLYETALTGLSDRQQEAAILRLEFGYSYPQIAEAIECTSPDAARMIVNRALVRLASSMGER